MIKKFFLPFLLVVIFSEFSYGDTGLDCLMKGKKALEGKDYNEALNFFKKACEMGVAKGCTNLGLMYKEGLGVSKDYRRAVELYSRACEMGYARGCNNLGLMYKKGLGVSKDYRRAVELYSRACEMGCAGGCKIVGENF